MNPVTRLPPGQHEISEFPRFGLSQFANRFPTRTDRIELEISGDVSQPLVVSDELRELPRVEQTSDFHCVTTWTVRSLRWSGYRFSDFDRQVVVPRARPLGDVKFVSLRGQDGYVTSLLLEDLLGEGVRSRT